MGKWSLTSLINNPFTLFEAISFVKISSIRVAEYSVILLGRFIWGEQIYTK